MQAQNSIVSRRGSQASQMEWVRTRLKSDLEFQIKAITYQIFVSVSQNHENLHMMQLAWTKSIMMWFRFIGQYITQPLHNELRDIYFPCVFIL